jgi:hypothetical protein
MESAKAVVTTLAPRAMPQCRAVFDMMIMVC